MKDIESATNDDEWFESDENTNKPKHKYNSITEILKNSLKNLTLSSVHTPKKNTPLNTPRKYSVPSYNLEDGLYLREREIERRNNQMSREESSGFYTSQPQSAGTTPSHGSSMNNNNNSSNHKIPSTFPYGGLKPTKNMNNNNNTQGGGNPSWSSTDKNNSSTDTRWDIAANHTNYPSHTENRFPYKNNVRKNPQQSPFASPLPSPRKSSSSILNNSMNQSIYIRELGRQSPSESSHASEHNQSSWDSYDRDSEVTRRNDESRPRTPLTASNAFYGSFTNASKRNALSLNLSGLDRISEDESSSMESHITPKSQHTTTNGIIDDETSQRDNILNENTGSEKYKEQIPSSDKNASQTSTPDATIHPEL